MFAPHCHTLGSYAGTAWTAAPLKQRSRHIFTKQTLDFPLTTTTTTTTPSPQSEPQPQPPTLPPFRSPCTSCSSLLFGCVSTCAANISTRSPTLTLPNECQSKQDFQVVWESNSDAPTSAVGVNSCCSNNKIDNKVCDG